MSEIDDHTLNACLARVIGKEVQEHTTKDTIPETYWLTWRDYGTLEQWDPLHDANQMEEVEAWVIHQPDGRGNTDIYVRYEAESKRWIFQIVAFTKDNESEVEGIDPDKKRAFALAIYQMEQSNNNNKED